MDVEAAVTRCIEYGLGQQQAIGDHDGGIGAKRGKGLLLFGRLERDRRAHRKAETLCFRVDGRRLDTIAPPAGRGGCE